MARVTSVAAPTRARRHAAGPWVAAVAFAAAMAVALLALYLVLPVVRGYGLPVGPDGPVYTWWTRYAEVFGLRGIAPGRPGVPGAALVVGEILGTDPVQTVALLGPAVAAACGLAGAAVVEALLGSRGIRALSAAVLTGSFAAYLAGGWLANLAQATLFLAAVAALGLAGRSWRGAWGGAGLLLAAALAHAVFTAMGVVIMGAAIAALLVEDIRARRRGDPGTQRAALRMAAGAVGGAAAGAVALAAVTGAPAVAADTAQDGFLRRHDVRGLLVERYRERLAGDATRAAVPVAIGAVLGAVGGRLLRRAPAAARFLLWILVSWAVVTAVGVVALLVTGVGPPNRVLVFGFFLPLAAAIGAEAVARRSGVAAAAVGVAIVVSAAVAMWGWYRQSPSVTEEELTVARRAAAVVERLPKGRPVVFMVDTDQPAAAFHIIRSGNVIRMALPPERLSDAHIAVGTPARYLRGEASLTGDREHDLISRAYLRETRGLRHRAAVLVLQPLTTEDLPTGRRGTIVAPGVEAWQGVPPGPTPTTGPLPVLSPVAWVVLSVGVLAVFAVLGGGWARWVLPGAGALAVASLAPAAGMAVAVVGGVAAAAIGPPWPAAAAAGLGAVGYVAASRVAERRTTRTTAV